MPQLPVTESPDTRIAEPPVVADPEERVSGDGVPGRERVLAEVRPRGEALGVAGRDLEDLGASRRRHERLDRPRRLLDARLG